MMSDHELIASLRRMKVETGSLVCLECWHERSCGIRGCAVMRAAADRLEALTQTERPSSVMAYRDGPER
nr:MAG TPA: hypothetical protein [Caudoviricetes sp.]